MTVVARRIERGVTELVGDEIELRARVAGLIAAGRLGSTGLVDSGRLANGACYAKVRLLPLVEPAPVRRELSPNVFLGGYVAAAALVAGAWLVFLIGHLTVVAVVAVGALLAWAGLGQVGACPGIHCPGCKHR